MDMPSAFNLRVRLDNVAVITIDVPDEKMNTLKAEFGVQVRAMLKQIRDNKAIRGLVFISAKPDNFIAGADINMIARAQSALEAEELARQGQQVMAEINGHGSVRAEHPPRCQSGGVPAAGLKIDRNPCFSRPDFLYFEQRSLFWCKTQEESWLKFQVC